jgi:hypothetical protein
MKPIGQTRWLTALEIALAVILPVAGFIIAAALYANGQHRAAGWVLAAAVVGAAFWAAVLL